MTREPEVGRDPPLNLDTLQITAAVPRTAKISRDRDALRGGRGGCPSAKASKPNPGPLSQGPQVTTGPG